MSNLMDSIKDSGERRTFETGAVRDMATGKGRFDLMPLKTVQIFLGAVSSTSFLNGVHDFVMAGESDALLRAGAAFTDNVLREGRESVILRVGIRFEQGAEKYGENNWQKGIPVKSFIDSALRHFFKHMAGETDEPHDTACIWNLLCAHWTCENHPELNAYRDEKISYTRPEIYEGPDPLKARCEGENFRIGPSIIPGMFPPANIPEETWRNFGPWWLQQIRKKRK